MCTHIHICLFRTCVCMYVCMYHYGWMNECMYVCMHVLYARMYVYVCIICTYVCVCMKYVRTYLHVRLFQT